VNNNQIKFNSKLNTGDTVTVTYAYYSGEGTINIDVKDLFWPIQNFTLPPSVVNGTLHIRKSDAHIGDDDWIYDPVTGALYLNKALKPSDTVKVSYRYIGNTGLGPFDYRENYINNEALSGVVLAFGRRAEVGEKLYVMVSDDREPVADVFGG